MKAISNDNIQIQLKDYKKELKFLHIKYILLIVLILLSFILLSSDNGEKNLEELKEVKLDPNQISLKIPLISLINDDDFKNKKYMILNEKHKRVFENIKINKIEPLSEEEKLVSFSVDKNQGNNFYFSSEEKYYLIEYFNQETKKIKKGQSNEMVF